MKKLYVIVIFFSFLLVAFTCKKEKLESATRSFYLGTTPWPPDFTKRGYDLSYGFIDKDCDLISHHFDDGVPWEEAYTNQLMPDALFEDLKRRIEKTPAGKKVLLSVAPLAISRKEKANYYKSPLADQFTESWKAKRFNDSTVVQAYVNYIQFLYDQLHPDFINYGVESNSGEWQDEAFADYKDFLAQVYAKLKVAYPSTPLFVSFMVTDDAKFLKRAKELEACTDWITLSAYPYTYIGSPIHGSSSPALIPENLFQSFVDINNAKPCAFAETGYIAEDMNLSFVQKEGNAQWQEDYVNYLFSFCQKNKAKFIVWFCAYDYSATLNTFKGLGYTDEIVLIWEHTGFYDAKMAARPSLQVWKEAMAKRIEN